MKREELKQYTSNEIEELDDARLEASEDGIIKMTRVYIASEVDNVIDDYVQLIKELEAENEKLKEHVSALDKNKGRWHIVADGDLPVTCEFVKAKLESGRQLKMKYANGNWFDSNEFFYDNGEDPITHWRLLSPTTEEK